MRRPNLVVIATLILLAFQTPGQWTAAAAKKGPRPKPAKQEQSSAVVQEVVLTNGNPLDSRAYAPIPSPDKKKPAAGATPAAKPGAAVPALNKLFEEATKSLAEFRTAFAEMVKPAAKVAKPPFEPAGLTAELKVTHRVILAPGQNIEIGTCLADVRADGFLSTITVTPLLRGSAAPQVMVEAHPTRLESFLAKPLVHGRHEFLLTYRHAAPPWRIAKYRIDLGDRRGPAAVLWAAFENPTPYPWSGAGIKLRDHGVEYSVGSVCADPRSSLIQSARPAAMIRVETLSVLHLPDLDAKALQMPPVKSGYLLINDSEGSASSEDLKIQDLAAAAVEIWASNGTLAVAGTIHTLPHKERKDDWPVTAKSPYLLPYAQLLESDVAQEKATIGPSLAAAYVVVGDRVELHVTRTVLCKPSSLPLLCLPAGGSAWALVGDLRVWAEECQIEMQKPVEDADSLSAKELKQMVASDPTPNAQNLGQLLRCRLEMNDEQEKIEKIKGQLAELQARRVSWKSQSALGRQQAMLRELTIEIDRGTRHVALREGEEQRARIEFERILQGPWFAEQKKSP